jgi:hypothetical protein
MAKLVRTAVASHARVMGGIWVIQASNPTGMFVVRGCPSMKRRQGKDAEWSAGAAGEGGVGTCRWRVAGRRGGDSIP